MADPICFPVCPKCVNGCALAGAAEERSYLQSYSPGMIRSTSNRKRGDPLSGYILLTCEHYTTWEEVHLYPRPPRRKEYFCSTCAKWRLRKKQPKAKVPDEPMF